MNRATSNPLPLSTSLIFRIVILGAGMSPPKKAGRIQNQMNINALGHIPVQREQ